ncbi:MAG: division/cell wall cluster transcriptional repressor MraZ [Bacteroidales bacterium]|nr:division/cell wall cluster transcriptional repressor MraZ [Bacteroidales bacterium]
MNFVGEYSAKLDDKGRLVFPSAFKSLCADTLSQGFVVKKSLFADCLEIFAYSVWERESEAVKAKLNLFNREHDAFWRAYMKNRAMVVPDEKLGRISIPKALLDSIGVQKEVVFCGKDFKIELWAKEKVDVDTIEGDDFVALAEKILG